MLKYWISQTLIKKVFNEKILYHSILESSEGKLQEYAKIYRVFHLKKLK